MPFRRNMKILILQVGQVDAEVPDSVRNGLTGAFPSSSCEMLSDVFPVPETAYNPRRHQYNSSIILSKVSEYAARSEADRVLGITDVDLYVPQMNFVFGEAQYPGKAALVSVCRLRPEFYGERPNKELFQERVVKEAIHEVGHTSGLGHCQDPRCVMFFSLHIGMTDRKEPEFCGRCQGEIEQIV